MSLVYGATGTLRPGPDRTLRAGRRRRSSALLLTGVVFIGRRHRLQVRRGAVPHVAAGRLPRRADADHAVHRLGAEAGRVRHGLPPAANRRRRRSTSSGGLLMAGLAAAVAGDRQPGRDRADQPQAHAGVFDRSRTSASCCSALAGGGARAIAAAMFYAISYVDHVGGGVRRDRRAVAAAASRPTRSTTSRASARNPRPARSGAVRDGFAGRRAAVPRLLGQAGGAARARCRADMLWLAIVGGRAP